MVSITEISSTIQKQQYQLLYWDQTDVSLIDTITARKIQLRRHPYHVQIKTASGQTRTVTPDRLWGYQQVGGARYRLYEGDVFEVVQGKTVLFYTRLWDSSDLAHPAYYFSITPTSFIWYLDKRNLKFAFSDDPCMREIINQLPQRDWLKTNYKGTCRLLDAYEYCQLVNKSN